MGAIFRFLMNVFTHLGRNRGRNLSLYTGLIYNQRRSSLRQKAGIHARFGKAHLHTSADRLFPANKIEIPRDLYPKTIS